MEIVPNRPEFPDEKSAREWQAAKAFVEKYGREFTNEADEICKHLTIEMMREYQRELIELSNREAGMKNSPRDEATLRKIKILQFRKLFSDLNQPCAEYQKERLSPRDFIKDCDLGPNATEDQMVRFWDQLRERLPERWRSEYFRWAHISFSDMTFPFFVWVCRPPTQRRGSFTMRMTKEEHAKYMEKLNKAMERRNS